SSGQCSVVLTAAVALSAQSCTTATVKATPSTLASNGGAICEGGTLKLFATDVAGGSYSWTGPGGFTSSAQNPSIPTATTANSGQYCVKVTVDSCPSAQSCTTATVNAIPSTAASNNGPILAGTTLQLSATSVTGGSYSWTGPGGFISSVQNPSITNATMANSGQYCVVVTANGCISAPSCTTATVNPVPICSINSGPSKVSPGATVTYT